MLEVFSRLEGRALLLELRGILDFATIGVFNERAMAWPPDVEAVTIDFSGLEFTDSTGIGAVIGAIYAASERGASVRFVGISEPIYDIFQTVGVFHILQTLQKGG